MDLLDEAENGNADPNTVEESDSKEEKVFTYKEPKWYTQLKNGDFDKILIKSLFF